MRNVEGELCVVRGPSALMRVANVLGGVQNVFYWSLFMGESVSVALLEKFLVLICLESSSERWQLRVCFTESASLASIIAPCGMRS